MGQAIISATTDEVADEQREERGEVGNTRGKKIKCTNRRRGREEAIDAN